MQAPVVLVTRPEPAAQRFAGQIAGLGLATVIAPLMRIAPVDHDASRIQAAAGVVLTSENAVPFAGPGRSRPAICVGPRTAAQARAAGFDVTQGPGDARGMIPLLKDLGEGWVHVRGAEVAAELPVPGVVVYTQQDLPLPHQGASVLRGTAPVILPLFSPRAAARAARAIRQVIEAEPRAPALWLVSISAAAHAAWNGAWQGPLPPGSRAEIADRPDAPAIRNIIARLAREQSGTARVEQQRAPI